MKEQLSLKSENGVLSKHLIKFPDIFDDILHDWYGIYYYNANSVHTSIDPIRSW